MQYNWFENTSPAAKIVLSLAFMVCSAIILTFLAILFAIPVFQKSPLQLVAAMSNIHNVENINILKYFQTVQSVGLFVIPPLILSYLFGYKPWQYLKIEKRPHVNPIIITFLIVSACLPFINFTEMLNSKLQLPQIMSGFEQWMKSTEENAAQLSKLFLQADTPGALLFNIFMMAVIPAIGEEFAFRGLLQRLFGEWFKNYHWGIWVSAIVFSAFHLQFYGFLPRMLLGVAFGYLFVWSGNLWFPIIAHLINNTLGIVFYYFYYSGSIGNSIEEIGANTQTWPLALGSLAFTLLLMFNFYRFYKYSKH